MSAFDDDSVAPLPPTRNVSVRNGGPSPAGAGVYTNGNAEKREKKGIVGFFNNKKGRWIVKSCNAAS